ncbi:MAG: cytochrome c3 family protein [Chitinophagaceae bacterium]
MKKLLVIALMLSAVIVFHQCISKQTSVQPAKYVGSDKCQGCHQKEFDLFVSSDHFHAMDTASEKTVKADFNNTSFIYAGDTAFFYKRGEDYLVKTTDSTGFKKEFKISYTFGWRPLQQYLVRFDDGRIQVLPFCWDTREKEKGGQRWFHLYNKEKIAPKDELFWMGINQNWNYMCADCHTTDYAQNFSIAENSFHSKWEESRVSCESCHGPASEHITWTEKRENENLFSGFSISLKAKSINWKIDPARQMMLPKVVEKNDTLIETCARCHARATRFTDEYKHGQSFLQSHIPATVDPVNYHIDGQIKEEDYEYGSFLQSKMYAAGVTCINCHEPHGMKVKAIGNTLCTSCHKSEKYDGPLHSYHSTSSTGNQCVSCHMPVSTYMVVDNRLDHSIRIPRPDLSLVNGTPNACNKCHTDKTVQWAASNFSKWFKAKIPTDKIYGELVYEIAHNSKEREPSLYELLTSKKIPAIIKATAMEQYGSYASQRIVQLVVDNLKSEDANLRRNAIKAMGNTSPELILANVQPLLYDKIAAVRMEAMNVVAAFSSRLGDADTLQFKKVMGEYIQVQENMSHRPEGYFNRAILQASIGNTVSAEQLYLNCIKIFPGFMPSYNNLIDLYREQGREVEGKKIIDKGLIRNPTSGYLHYGLALWYIRQKQNAIAMKELMTAAKNAAADPQIIYGYAIGLFSSGDSEKAIKLLELYISKYGNQPQILDGLISMNQDLNRPAQAGKYSSIRKTVFGY